MRVYSFRVGHGTDPDDWPEYLRKVSEAAKSAGNKTHGPLENLKSGRHHLLRPDNPKYEKGRCDFVSQAEDKKGQRCKCWAMKGATRCRLHGGYRQNPRHPGSVRLYKQGAVDEETQHREASKHLEKHKHTIEAENARSALRERKMLLRAQIIMEGINAQLADDTGKAWRRWLNILDQRTKA